MYGTPPAPVAEFCSRKGLTLLGAEQIDIEPVVDGFVVAYRCRIEGEAEPRTIYVSTSSHGPTNEHTLVIGDVHTGTRRTVWEYPHDPWLPSFAAVTYPEAAGVVLAKFGIDATGAILHMQAYRPSKRAVLRIESADRTWYAKVVPPVLAEGIHDRHVAFLGAGIPVPRSVGWSDSGLVLLDRLDGDPAIAHLRTIAAAPTFLPSLGALVEAIGAVPMTEPARESLAVRADWYAQRMSDVLPRAAERARAIVSWVTHEYTRLPAGGPQTIHADLHLGQVFVDPADPGRVTGILDIDTAGRGDPADDAAALYAHLVVSGLERWAAGDRPTADAAMHIARDVRRGWPPQSRAYSIAATHLLGHALAIAGRADAASARITDRLLSEAELLLSRQR